MTRLAVFLGTNVVFAAVVVVTWHILNQPIVSAAIIGAWPVSLIAIYDRFVNVPTLEITFDANTPNVYKPSLTMLPQGANWNFLRVLVRNSGFSVARNCTAELRVLRRPSQGGQVCPAPADEPKGLKWAGRNPGQPRDIPPKRGEGILDVLLNDTSIPQQPRSSWHLANVWGPLIAWAATHDVYLLGAQQRAQDAFCQGTYIVEVTVFPENGTPKSRKYYLNVDSNWANTTLTPVPNGRQEVDKKEDELEKGFIVPVLTRFFDIVRRFSFVRGTGLRVRDKILIKWSAGTIEAYVLFCLVAEVILLGLLFVWPSLSNNWGFFIIVPILLSLRLLDILRAGYDWLIIAPYRGLQIISTPRLLILSLINYVELAVIFGVLTFLAREGFHPQFQSSWHSFYYSVSVITTLGANVEPVSAESRGIFLSEIMLGLTFLLLIIARAVSLLPHSKD